MDYERVYNDKLHPEAQALARILDKMNSVRSIRRRKVSLVLKVVLGFAALAYTGAFPMAVAVVFALSALDGALLTVADLVGRKLGRGIPYFYDPEFATEDHTPGAIKMVLVWFGLAAAIVLATGFWQGILTVLALSMLAAGYLILAGLRMFGPALVNWQSDHAWKQASNKAEEGVRSALEGDGSA